MSNTITKVFLIVGVLVLIFLAWQLVFQYTGIVPNAYNAVATRINTIYASSRGVDSKLMPLYGDTNNGFKRGTPTLTASDFDVYSYH